MDQFAELKIVDAHHHLWRYTRTEFGWIGPGMEELQRDFLIDELSEQMQSAGVDATVAVQARQTVAETRWLLEVANRSKGTIQGVVGWVPLADRGIADVLRGFAHEPLLKGVRHVVQDEPDDNFLLREDFNRGVAGLAEYGLTYDLLIHARHLPQAVRFVRMHPQQVMVLDHLAKPSILAGTLAPWRDNLRQLAEAPNVFCKLSGLVTEADWTGWTLDDLRPYLDVALETFGPERLMAGSDWPVCLLASSYRQWWSTLYEWLEPLSRAAQEQILSQTARRAYKLQPSTFHPAQDQG